MNRSISSLLNDLPRGRRLGRAMAHRWPALTVATVAVALPLSVAFAAGPSIFNGNSSQPAVTAIAGGSAAIESIGRLWAHTDHNEPTVLSQNFRGNVALKAETSGGDAVDAQSQGGRAIRAVTKSTSAEALLAIGEVQGATIEGKTGTGLLVRGQTEGVVAFAGTRGVFASGSQQGVFAKGDTTAGSFGTGVLAQGDEGVIARGTTVGVEASAKGTAVSGISDNGVGGFFAGKEAPIRMAAASTPGAPTSGVHHRGELYVDSNGALFYCTTDGTPGTWKKVVLQ
jgi:hypothetical protein